MNVLALTLGKDLGRMVILKKKKKKKEAKKHTTTDRNTRMQSYYTKVQLEYYSVHI